MLLKMRETDSKSALERATGRVTDFGWELWRLWHYTLTPHAMWRKVVRYHQRGVRGWADEDTWSFDYYLSRVIVEGLDHLRVNAHGFPSTLVPDDATEPDVEDGAQRWNQILYEIMEGFAATSLLSQSVQFTIVDDTLIRDHALEAKLLAAQELGFARFKEYYGAFWD
jgi:hypothetical protein